jgi:hypothetical protein
VAADREVAVADEAGCVVWNYRDGMFEQTVAIEGGPVLTISMSPHVFFAGLGRAMEAASRRERDEWRRRRRKTGRLT